MVIAGSNTFYMKIEDKNKFSVTSWYCGFLGRYMYYLTPYLTNKEITDQKKLKSEKTEYMYKLNGTPWWSRQA